MELENEQHINGETSVLIQSFSVVVMFELQALKSSWREKKIKASFLNQSVTRQ